VRPTDSQQSIYESLTGDDFDLSICERDRDLCLSSSRSLSPISGTLLSMLHSLTLLARTTKALRSTSGGITTCSRSRYRTRSKLP
jgi:hypothetical protein